MKNKLSKGGEYRFSKYTKEQLFDLYMVLKQRILDENGYVSNNYKKVLLEMMKEIKEILDK